MTYVCMTYVCMTYVSITFVSMTFAGMTLQLLHVNGQVRHIAGISNSRAKNANAHAYFFQGTSLLDGNVPLLGLVKLDSDGSTLSTFSLKARVEKTVWTSTKK